MIFLWIFAQGTSTNTVKINPKNMLDTQWEMNKPYVGIIEKYSSVLIAPNHW